MSRKTVKVSAIRGSGSRHGPPSSSSPPPRPQHVPRTVDNDEIITKDNNNHDEIESNPLATPPLTPPELSPAPLRRRVSAQRYDTMAEQNELEERDESFEKEHKALNMRRRIPNSRRRRAPNARRQQYRSPPNRSEWDVPQGTSRSSSGMSCIYLLKLCIQLCASLLVVTLAITLYTSPYVTQRASEFFQKSNKVADNALVRPANLIPVWRDAHKTYSSMVTNNNTQVELLWRVRQSIRYHLLLAKGGIKCLCMHHLHSSTFPLDDKTAYRRVCGVYNGIYSDGPGQNGSCVTVNAEQVYFMVNPRPIGKSKNPEDVLTVMDWSISCPHGTPPRKRLRPKNMFIEWEDERANTLFAQFRGAKCMQLAMEEFVGDSHCFESPK